jgi:hypothetical protein
MSRKQGNEALHGSGGMDFEGNFDLPTDASVRFQKHQIQT